MPEMPVLPVVIPVMPVMPVMPVILKTFIVLISNPGVVINPLPRIETNSKRHDIFGDEGKLKPGRNESHTYKKKCEVKNVHEQPEEKTLEELFSNLRTHYKPAPKALAERYRFMSRKQNQGESTAQYLAELRPLAINCKFDTDLDTRLRDQFIFGLRNEVAQKQLFTRPDEIKLEEVVAITTAHELSEQSLSLIRGSTHQREEVNKIRNISRQKENQYKKNGKSSNNWKSRKECTRCGSTDHNPYNCPHKDSKCYACGKQGYLACKCRNGSQKQGQETKKQIKQNNMIDIRTAEVLSSSQSAQRKIWITVKVNGIPHRMEMDTGCERSIISKKFWEDSKDRKLITTENIEMLPVTLKEIRTATARDKVLSKVLSFISSKWPNSIGKEDEDLHSYFRKREELTIQQGVIMWGIRVVIPYTLQKKLLQSLHETHTGIVKMKGLARQYIWWPNMDKEIEDIAKSCTSCCASRPDPPSAPLHPWQFPEKPWQRLHIDLAGPLQNRMFLIIMDAHIKWPEVYDMHGDTTSKKVIEKLRDCFVRFGIPEQIISDNGRQFVSAEFKRFCRNNGIRHTTSSACHPRTNGEAERFVQTLKKAVSKSEGELIFRVQRFLFSYRCTPHTTTGTSPAELLIGRRPRNVFDLVKPDVQRTVAAAQARQEKNYNSRVRNRKFEEGEEVWVRTYSKNEAKWSLGVIVKVLGPVTYLVRVGD
ncbi:PREDICTED: uncharacterized protein K02A2.6-like [Vollenhovia emeryi]|uniref:uncharacterized protein K02A2.6-like n=1 Tax=Vollenhovia emeryi TaxID=411798 RepID=UPI0005F3BF5A|nr:PREDICTED: uncharacterized protein K02A2.6-like [Vollenhovia emeryi]